MVKCLIAYNRQVASGDSDFIRQVASGDSDFINSNKKKIAKSPAEIPTLLIVIRKNKCADNPDSDG
jgi:hypothetical protein